MRSVPWPPARKVDMRRSAGPARSPLGRASISEELVETVLWQALWARGLFPVLSRKRSWKRLAAWIRRPPQRNHCPPLAHMANIDQLPPAGRMAQSAAACCRQFADEAELRLNANRGGSTPTRIQQIRTDHRNRHLTRSRRLRLLALSLRPTACISAPWDETDDRASTSRSWSSTEAVWCQAAWWRLDHRIMNPLTTAARLTIKGDRRFSPTTSGLGITSQLSSRSAPNGFKETNLLLGALQRPQETQAPARSTRSRVG